MISETKLVMIYIYSLNTESTVPSDNQSKATISLFSSKMNDCLEKVFTVSNINVLNNGVTLRGSGEFEKKMN